MCTMSVSSHTYTHTHTHTHIYYCLVIVLLNNYRQFQRCPDPPLTLADPECVVKATKCLKNATRPLIVIGKGIDCMMCDRFGYC